MTNILNRSVAPERFAIQSIPELNFASERLANRLKTWCVEGGTEDLLKIDVVFRAGTRYEDKAMLASLCNNMLKEGTERFSAREISETIDFYGAHISTSLSKDHGEISLLCLKKHLPALIDIFTDILLVPTFPENEFNAFKNRSKSKLAVNLDKVEFQCRLLFSQLFFGDSAYCDRFSLEDYDMIDQADIETFFRQQYTIDDAICVISGKDTAYAKTILDEALTAKKDLLTSAKSEKPDLIWKYGGRVEKRALKKGAVQTAIRMGIPAVNRKHPDYAALYFGNVLLGGYFGSRLMQNIREEKGFTYGIGSSYNNLEHGAYISINTQVGSENTLATCDEIIKEIKRLSTDLVSDEELELVRNYVVGNLLKQFDGPFAISDRLKIVLTSDLKPDVFARFSKEIFALKPFEIRIIFTKYFDPSLICSAIVGEW